MLQVRADNLRTELDWSRLVQLLNNDPVENLDDGECTIKNSVEKMQSLRDQVKSLEEEQDLAFGDLAIKEDALSDAEDKIGQRQNLCTNKSCSTLR